MSARRLGVVALLAIASVASAQYDPKCPLDPTRMDRTPKVARGNACTFQTNWCDNGLVCVYSSGCHCELGSAPPTPTTLPTPTTVPPTPPSTSTTIRPPTTTTVTRPQTATTEPTTTVTVPPSTTSTRPPTTSTTLPLPEVFFPVVRFAAIDVGRRFPNSQEINYNPITGVPANQYVRMVRALTQHTIYHPALLRAFRDFCPEMLPRAVGTFNTVYGKFSIHYSLKDMPQAYSFHANYIMDLWQSSLDLFAECIAGREAQLPPDIAALMQTKPPPPIHLPGTGSTAGAFDPKHVFKPLTAAQCAAARQALAAHEQGVGSVKTAQFALTQLARDPYEATLFDIQFVGTTDPTLPTAREQYLTAKTHVTYTGWFNSLHCDDGLPPDMVEGWIFNMEHARYHAMRAANVPGYHLRHAIDLIAASIPKCRVVHGVDRKFNPTTKLWEWAREKYDNHSCLEDDQ